MQKPLHHIKFIQNHFYALLLLICLCCRASQEVRRREGKDMCSPSELPNGILKSKCKVNKRSKQNHGDKDQGSDLEPENIHETWKGPETCCRGHKGEPGRGHHTPQRGLHSQSPWGGVASEQTQSFASKACAFPILPSQPAVSHGERRTTERKTLIIQ